MYAVGRCVGCRLRPFQRFPSLHVIGRACFSTGEKGNSSIEELAGKLEGESEKSNLSSSDSAITAPPPEMIVEVPKKKRTRKPAAPKVVAKEPAATKSDADGERGEGTSSSDESGSDSAKITARSSAATTSLPFSASTQELDRITDEQYWSARLLACDRPAAKKSINKLDMRYKMGVDPNSLVRKQNKKQTIRRENV